jgi:hypothetical protein
LRQNKEIERRTRTAKTCAALKLACDTCSNLVRPGATSARPLLLPDIKIV